MWNPTTLTYHLKNYNTNHYNLRAIIVVGNKVDFFPCLLSLANGQFKLLDSCNRY